MPHSRMHTRQISTHADKNNRQTATTCNNPLQGRTYTLAWQGPPFGVDPSALLDVRLWRTTNCGERALLVQLVGERGRAGKGWGF